MAFTLRSASSRLVTCRFKKMLFRMAGTWAAILAEGARVLWDEATARGQAHPQGAPVLVQPPRAPRGLGGPRSDGRAGLLCVCVGGAGGNHHFLRPGWQTGSLSAPPCTPPQPGWSSSSLRRWTSVSHSAVEPPWGRKTRPTRTLGVGSGHTAAPGAPLSDPGTPTCALNSHNLPTSRGHFLSAGGSGPRPHPLLTWGGRLTWSTALVRL